MHPVLKNAEGVIESRNFTQVNFFVKIKGNRLKIFMKTLDYCTRLMIHSPKYFQNRTIRMYTPNKTSSPKDPYKVIVNYVYHFTSS